MTAARRAERLLRWYPRPWRDRYGDEFTELLISDITERPSAPGRTIDIVRNGVMARLSDAGLAGSALTAPGGAAEEMAAARASHVAASLASLGTASAVFLVVGAAQWSQLLISWVWAVRLRERSPGGYPPVFAADRLAALGTSVAMLTFLALGVLAALPVLATVADRLRSPRVDGQRRRLAWPAVALVAALTILVTGGRALENNWIGTGGLHSPVPGGLAAFIWAVTLFVSAYWAHPAMFATLPAAERGWMVVSPLVLAVAVVSAAVLVRRSGLSPRIARLEAWLGIACCAVMTAFLGLCAGWVTYDGPLATRLSGFHAGWINIASTGVLALALIAGLQAARTAMRGLGQAGS